MYALRMQEMVPNRRKSEKPPRSLAGGLAAIQFLTSDAWQQHYYKLTSHPVPFLQRRMWLG
ncbi:hypothetical protein ZHAS_00018062 [Anopheles sinensis]|uniref:Uncharacterized protein n=1 Tax=Anopheles sinensis TaxID=74873 RepID=A0A084WIH5_ANOSI|nr:hypothetical protein ZHAS_00018062 [Anopheles sinensis]